MGGWAGLGFLGLGVGGCAVWGGGWGLPLPLRFAPLVAPFACALFPQTVNGDAAPGRAAQTREMLSDYTKPPKCTSTRSEGLTRPLLSNGKRL